MKRCLAVLLIIACSASCNPRLSAPAILRLTMVSDTLVGQIQTGSSNFVGSSGYSIAGKTGGNVIPFVVDALGLPIPPCAFVTPGVVTWRPETIPPGETKVIWRATVGSFAKLHCLEPGRYTLVIVYRNPEGELLFSNQVELEID